KSRVVLEAALARPGVADLPSVRAQADPVAWLERQIRADFTVAPEILRVVLAGSDPTELQVLLRAVRDAYLDEITAQEQRPQTERLDRLRKLHDEYSAALAERRKVIRELAEGLGASDPTTLGQKQQLAQARAGEQF